MLIPTPHMLNHQLHYNFFISKLPLGQKYKTDFVYLTKSSDSWWIVLMELENQHKKMFKGNYKHAEFSKDFHASRLLLFLQAFHYCHPLQNNYQEMMPCHKKRQGFGLKKKSL